MSATLGVSVIVSTFEDDLAGGAMIVGHIYPAGATGVARRSILIPCGTSVTPERYDVTPGRYVVSATLPSGAVLMEDVEARDGQETLVALDASDSPYETHSWQYLMGNIEPSRVYHDPSTVPVPRSRGSRITARPGGADGVDPAGDAEPPATGRPVATWVGSSKTMSWSFASMNALATEAADAPIADLIADSPPRIVPEPDATDGTSHLFRFGADGPVSAPGGPQGTRQFLVVGTADTSYLVTLPVPWGSAQVEVLVNARQSPTGSAVAVTVRDPAVGAGLAYMARGALDTAAELFTDVESMLYSKNQNPLSAAAGGYVLVGSDLTDEPRQWDSWLEHLRDWFGWMSDGSVLCATRRLRRARTEADLRQARDGLIEAYDRGVPFYTLGLSRLVDGLSEFPDDPECVSRLEQVRRLSWRVDMREPFVIVNLRGRAQ
ncbi:hypothetical protein OG883_36760 [Streptomyces sp. NBC_01142]|uniref:hypothetical protein n=1 Tax=Streptomyces sp. NBC_01142 TaxID=2975865 RepID=UPI00224D75ED|nr:hypothetical protein [Streptomyces sp. NBC_01142]MCX4825315.1 hypothetical protein [Streptomyces sp. NBC_01142]